MLVECPALLVQQIRAEGVSESADQAKALKMAKRRKYVSVYVLIARYLATTIVIM